MLFVFLRPVKGVKLVYDHQTHFRCPLYTFNLQHSRKKRKDSLETRAEPDVFSL